MTEKLPGDDSISTNELFELLASERRRVVVEYLLRQDNPVTVGELVDHIVAETEPTDGRPKRDSHASVVLSLHHVHLPKMSDVGVIEYDTERQLVRGTGELRMFEPYLTQLRADDS